MNLSVSKRNFLIILLVLTFTSSCVVHRSFLERKDYKFYEKLNISLTYGANNFNLKGFIFDYDSYIKILIQNDVGITFVSLKIYNDSIKIGGLLGNNISEDEFQNLFKYSKVKNVIEKVLTNRLDPKQDRNFLFSNGIDITEEGSGRLLFRDLKKNSELGTIEYIKTEKRLGMNVPVNFKLIFRGHEASLKTKEMRFYKWESQY
jgi:hypothetical protein